MTTSTIATASTKPMFQSDWDKLPADVKKSLGGIYHVIPDPIEEPEEPVIVSPQIPLEDLTEREPTGSPKVATDAHIPDSANSNVPLEEHDMGEEQQNWEKNTQTEDEADKAQQQDNAKDDEGFYVNIVINYCGVDIQVGVKLNSDYYLKHYDASKSVENRADNIDVLNLINDMREYGIDEMKEHLNVTGTLAIKGQGKKVLHSPLEKMRAEKAAAELEASSTEK